MANDAGKILNMIKEQEIEWVDLRFTDPKGKWQHLSMVSGLIDEVSRRAGITKLTDKGQRDLIVRRLREDGIDLRAGGGDVEGLLDAPRNAP